MSSSVSRVLQIVSSSTTPLAELPPRMSRCTLPAVPGDVGTDVVSVELALTVTDIIPLLGCVAQHTRLNVPADTDVLPSAHPFGPYENGLPRVPLHGLPLVPVIPKPNMLPVDISARNTQVVSSLLCGLIQAHTVCGPSRERLDDRSSRELEPLTHNPLPSFPSVKLGSSLLELDIVVRTRPRLFRSPSNGRYSMSA